MIVLPLLAQVPESYFFISPFKLAAIVLVFLGWALFAAWVDKDAAAVPTYRSIWNLLVLGSGAAATLVGLFMPVFWLGFPLMIAIVGTLAGVYVVHRNGLVEDNDRVLTAAHFQRLMSEGLGRKKKTGEVTERVRLTGANRKVVAVPEEENEREKYRLAQELFWSALFKRAGIVEIMPIGQQGARINYIIDGWPVEGEHLTRFEGEALSTFLKQIGGLSLEERRKPQRGWILAAIGDAHKHKVQVRSEGSPAGEKVSVRIVYGEGGFKVPDLGFLPQQLEAVRATKDVNRGVIVVSGPPGSGVTTSVYSFTRDHDRFLQNIQVMEYEKDLDIDNVTQTVYSPADGVVFSERLMKIVRTDPDIIVLPDIRDRDAAVIACKAASEKQKVYVGIVANDIADAIRQWINLVGDKALVAKSLLAVSNQRLVRLLCSECKQAYQPDPQTMRKLNLPEDKPLYRAPEPSREKRQPPPPCQACNALGFTGRTAVFEWLTVDEPLREVIRRSTSFSDIQSYVQKKVGLSLQAAALQKVLEGQTSIQEVARAVRGNGAAARPSAGGAARPSNPAPDGTAEAAAGGR